LFVVGVAVLLLHACSKCAKTFSSINCIRQEQERIMFVHFGMATWQGSEGDNWTTPLNQVNPTDLNTDQWCEVAQSWGAKMVLFVAKHVGGFCWWQTDTSDYGVRQIPWRDGKGDVLESLSASCRKYNLDLGVYIYPGDEHWGAMVGSGGITSDPSKQETYTQIFQTSINRSINSLRKNLGSMV